jgi:hypothetical protein
MTQLRAAMWVHGTIVQVEYPNRLVATDSDTNSSGFRRGWGTLFRGGDPDPIKASNWFHIPISKVFSSLTSIVRWIKMRVCANPRYVLLYRPSGGTRKEKCNGY